MWTVDWDGGFVVGGDGNRRLTPGFRLREFRRPNGSVRVHRELVSSLQLLRNRLGVPLKVVEVAPDGLSAVVRSDPGGTVRVAIDDPLRMPPIDLEQALETAFAVTAAFETAGDKFQQVTGNFDGAGLSFGPAQVNFGTGTLVPLFRAFQAADEAALAACFDDPDDYDEWLRVLDMSRAQQVAWANGISTGRGAHDVVEPWKGYLRRVGSVERFRAIMVERILSDYGRRMLRSIDQLRQLRPDLAIDHLRCVCSLYDLVVQQGSLDKALPAIAARVAREEPADQFALTHIAVEERGRAALAAWRDDACSRRLGILHGVPETVGGRQRANLNFYMLRDVRVRNAADLITGDVDDEFVRVSHTLATGGSLLA
ncbi:MAG: hypothetical protein AB7P99_21680 [Vicinamibacterales bacterium]